MARLRRQWGVQFRHQESGEWVTGAAAPAATRRAAYSGVDALFPENEARVVSRVVSDWEVDVETPQPPRMVCPLDGGTITTSQGRHAPRCIHAICRYEGVGVVDRGQASA